MICVFVGCASPGLPPPVFSGSLADALGPESRVDAATIDDPFRLDDDARAWLNGQIPQTTFPGTRITSPNFQ
jgi:hypothetical protein